MRARQGGTARWWWVGVALVLAACASEGGGGTRTRVPITELKSVVGKWDGLLSGLSSRPSADEDFVDVTIKRRCDVRGEGLPDGRRPPGAWHHRAQGRRPGPAWPARLDGHRPAVRDRRPASAGDRGDDGRRPARERPPVTQALAPGHGPPGGPAVPAGLRRQFLLPKRGATPYNPPSGSRWSATVVGGFVREPQEVTQRPGGLVMRSRAFRAMVVSLAVGLLAVGMVGCASQDAFEARRPVDHPEARRQVDRIYCGAIGGQLRPPT